MNQIENGSITTGFDLAHLVAAFWRGLQKLWLAAVIFTLLTTGILGFQSWRNYRPSYTASATFTVYVGTSLQSNTPTYNAAAAQQLASTFP